MYPHRIRLRGPWEVEVPWEPVRTVRFPIRWAELEPPAIAVRAFGSPSRLDSHERVWLVMEGIAGRLVARLNDHRFECDDTTTFQTSFGVDVTEMLGQRNRLELTLGPERIDLAEPIDVALEIRASAWLESLRLVRDAGVWLEGSVVGESAEPLEIHVVADRHGCGDHTTTASLAGTPFRIRLDRDVDAVRVELIHVASIWWAADVSHARDE